MDLCGGVHSAEDLTVFPERGDHSVRLEQNMESFVSSLFAFNPHTLYSLGSN